MTPGIKITTKGMIPKTTLENSHYALPNDKVYNPVVQSTDYEENVL
jgi:hypothetical protein